MFSIASELETRITSRRKNKVHHRIEEIKSFWLGHLQPEVQTPNPIMNISYLAFQS